MTRPSPVSSQAQPRDDDLLHRHFEVQADRHPDGTAIADGANRDVAPYDRVLQGASRAFDLSVEEMWLAFHSGATLVPGSSELMHAGPDLGRLLADAGVTVLSCVPTLLATLPTGLRTVRLLILGGEVCPSARCGRTFPPPTHRQRS